MRSLLLVILLSVAACSSPSGRIEIEPIGTIRSLSAEVDVRARVIDKTGVRDPDALPPTLAVEPPDLAVIAPGGKLRCLRDGSGILVAHAGVLRSQMAFVCDMRAAP